MNRVPKEPKMRTPKSLARVRKKIAGSRHFESLVKAIREAASEHLATPADLRQAAGFIAREREWQLYAALLTGSASDDKPVRHLDEDEDDDDLV